MICNKWINVTAKLENQFILQCAAGITGELRQEFFISVKKHSSV